MSEAPVGTAASSGQAPAALAAIDANTPLTSAQAEICAATSPLLAGLVGDGLAIGGLREIVRKYAVIDRPQAGEVVIRKGTFGGDVFFPLWGALRIIDDAPPGLSLRAMPERRRGERPAAAAAWRSRLMRLWRLWRYRQIPEVRYFSGGDSKPGPTVSVASGAARLVFSQRDREAIAERCKTRRFAAADKAIVGDQAALGHGEQAATVFADEDSVLLKMHWRGLRALHSASAVFRAAFRRERGGVRVVQKFLGEFELFAGLPQAALAEIAKESAIEIYGERDWARGGGGGRKVAETMVAAEGDYLNGLFLIMAGFGRVSQKLDSGERTTRYLRRGDIYGLWAVRKALSSGKPAAARRSLRAIKYLEILVVPVRLAEKHLGDALRKRNAPGAPPEGDQTWLSSDAADFLIENLLLNGKKTMLIDLNRCVHCDDCVRACAATHGSPRFVRTGPAFMNIMAASACMHCAEPLCLADCPTGAIHRDADSGNVVIEEQKCIGCGACAKGCVYGNIRMVETRDFTGAIATDAASGAAIVKATKCNFCQGVSGGPACVRACPHDALIRADMSDQTALLARGA
jgi:Fe-S-cluster-containing dehydrogenase component